jgi:hypothetical protein
LSLASSGSGISIQNASFARWKKSSSKNASFQYYLDREELERQKLDIRRRLQTTLYGLEEEELSKTHVGAWSTPFIIKDASITSSTPAASTSTTQERLKEVLNTPQRPAFCTDIDLNGSNHSIMLEWRNNNNNNNNDNNSNTAFFAYSVVLTVSTTPKYNTQSSTVPPRAQLITSQLAIYN